MASGYIGEADIVIGADATNLGNDLQKQASAAMAAAGKKLASGLADAMGARIAATSSKVTAPLERAAKSAANSVQRSVGSFAAGFKSAEAAASSFTGKLGSMGGAARKAADSTKTAFGNVVAAAQRLPGPLGAFANIAVSAFANARKGLQDFSSGWKSAEAGVSSFTGIMGNVGTVARSAASAAGNALKTAIPAGARIAFNALKSASTAAWDALKSGAEAAAKAAGDVLKAGLEGSVKTVAVGFSAIIGTAMGKGFARLKSLDTANARLKGLGMSAEDVKSSMDSAGEAVSGTAFSMADAANAAGMLASAGTQTGAQMDGALSAIVASAAASGSAIGDITPIFTKMAAKGVVSGDVMAQMLDRGINASGALAKSLNKTTDEIASMVSSGEISFDQFTEALNNDLSLLAASMGGTLGGMVTNIGAAMGRMGAELQKPLFDAILVAMPSVLDLIKRIEKAFKELIAPLQGTLEPMFMKFAERLDKINFTATGIGEFTKSLTALLPVIGGLLGLSGGLLKDLPIVGSLFDGLSGPVGVAAGALAALTMVDPSVLADGFANVGQFIADKLPGMIGMAKDAILKGISNLSQNLPIMLNGIVDVVVTSMQQIVPALVGLIPAIVQAIASLIPSVIDALLRAAPLLLGAAMALFEGITVAVLESLPEAVSTLADALPGLVETLVDAVPLMLEGALSMFEGIMDALVTVLPQVIEGLVNAIPGLLSALINALPRMIQAGIDFFLGLLSALAEALPVIIQAVIGAIPSILQALIGAIPQLIQAGFDMFFGLVDGLIDALPLIIESTLGMIPVIVSALIESIPELIKAGFQLFVGLIDGLLGAIPEIFKAITGKLLPSIWDAITGKKKETSDKGLELGNAAAGGLGSASTSFATAGGSLADSANASMSARSEQMQLTGAALGTAATGGMDSTTNAMTASADALGANAATALSAHTGGMESAAAGLGAGAATGLAGQVTATSNAAGSLANAATIDVKAKTNEAGAGGKKIAAAFASGITSGKGPAASAAKSVAASAQAALASVTGFVNIGARLSGGIATGIRQATPEVTSALTAMSLRARTIMVQEVVGTIGQAFTALWTVRVSPTLSKMTSGFSTSMQSIRDKWGGMISNLLSGYNSRLKPLMDNFSRLVKTGPPNAFRDAVGAIERAWSGLIDVAKRPVRFTIQTVMNGLIGAMNQLPGVNVPKLSLPSGFARGGILPGMSSMGQGDDQLIMARRGEGMMVSEALRSNADRQAFLAANAMGRRGVGFASMLQGYARGGLITPLPKGSFSVSQPFHAGHNGIDLAAAMGTKILAAARGVVGMAQSVPMGGNEIYIQHANGMGTRYSHLSQFAVRAGQKVAQGQVIGYVGSTGMSTGPHLHYMTHAAPGDGGMGRAYQNIMNPTGFLGVYGQALDPVFDILEGLADKATSQFRKKFGTGNMFNDGTASVLSTAAKQAVAWGTKQMGFDDLGSAWNRAFAPMLYDNGGMIPHGGTGINLSGKPEAVLTNPEWKFLRKIADPSESALRGWKSPSLAGGRGSTGDALAALATPEGAALVAKLSGGRSVTIEKGAIVVQGSEDSKRDSLEILKRLAEELER